MEKFKKVTEPREIEFFSIESSANGDKQIHIGGYLYKSDTDFGEGCWRSVEYCFCIVPLKEFIEDYNNIEDYIDNIESEAKQYIGDCTDEEVIDIINTYFDGNPADYELHYGEITEETPCGNYAFFL